MTKPVGITEHSEQAAVIQWKNINLYRYPDLAWLLAVPNGAKLPYTKNKFGKRFSPQAHRLLAEGLLPGVSDLFLPVPRWGFHGLWIEMKVGNNKPTPDQLAFMEAMNRYGYLATACWYQTMTIRTICCYLGIDP